MRFLHPSRSHRALSAFATRLLGAALALLPAAAIAQTGAGPSTAPPSAAPAATPATPTTPATPSASEAEARELFVRGVAMADAERWGEAVDFFRRSRALLERPNTVFNLANGLLRVGRVGEALRAFEDFLRISDPQRDVQLRAQAAALAENARASLGTLRLHVAPASAEVFVDGTARPGTAADRELHLDPGAHSVIVTAPGFDPRTIEVSATPGGQLEQTVALAETVAPRAHLSVGATAPGAVIRVDGERVGDATSAVVELPPGRHLVRVEARDHEPFQRWVDLRADERARVDATLRHVSPPITQNPWLWVGVGVVAVGAGAALWYYLSPDGVYGGSTGQVLTVNGH